MRRHWSRFLIQIAILISMVVVNGLNHDVFIALVSISIIVLPVATWTVFAILLWLSRRAPDIESLSERTADALSAAMGSSVAAVIGAALTAKGAGIISVSLNDLMSVGLAFVVVTISVPSLMQLPIVRDVWLPMVRGRD
jgi:uncharacterized iron-regulated membrane protein